MRKFITKVMPVMLFCIFFCSCEEWTIPEADIHETPENTEEYYANLRLWKATSADRQVSHGWFGGWTGTGASMVGSLAGLPDSMDLVSIWGDWRNMTDAKKADLEFVQKVKGTKVVATTFLPNVGDEFTPEGQTRFEYWGWDPNETATSAEPSENQKAAIQRYARAIADGVLSRGYNGLDIDFEGGGDLMNGPLRWKVFIEELGKYLGPKSGTDNLLILDYYGGFGSNGGLASYFNYFIQQVYSWQVGTTLAVWNSRISTLISGCVNDELTAEEAVKKYIITDSFEDATSGSRGGRDHTREDGVVVPAYFGMATWEPLVNGKRYQKGGVGVYHIEYAYSVSGNDGFYPFTRRVIQIMNPASK
jgi:hypothetical protein